MTVALGLDEPVGEAVGVRPVVTVTVAVTEALLLAEEVPDVVVVAVGVRSVVTVIVGVTLEVKEALTDEWRHCGGSCWRQAGRQ